MQKFFLCLLLASAIGCQTNMANELTLPEFPEHEASEISLPVYDEEGEIDRKSLVLQDPSDYSEKRASSNFSLALGGIKGKGTPEVVYTSSYNVPYGSWVVISIPDDIRQGSARKNVANVRSAESTTKDIDKSLPTKGKKGKQGNKKPSVAQKQEAKPQEAEKSAKEIYSTTGYYNYAENQIEKELLRIGFNVVDRSKYLAKVKEITAGIFEDVSDVLRLAAQDSTVKSDFILQINKLSFGKTNKTLYLRSFPEIKAYLDKFPEVAPQVPKTYTYPEYNVVFDAKLIEVKSGRIMWLGNYRVDSGQVLSKNAMNILMTMAVRKYPSNEKEIKEFIEFQNTPDQRVKRYNKEVVIPEVEYDYSFDFSVFPDLNELEKEESNNELFKDHREALIRTVSQELIRTIPGE
jgi:hypothetical protein